MAIELEVKKSITVDEGKHTGVISRIEQRNVDYQGDVITYIDVFISNVDGNKDLELKYGAPAAISERTKLGKLLSNFTKLEPGKKVDIEKILLNQKVQFMTINEETDRGTFARIVDGSLKPIK
jgi:hypothetical protein